MLPDAPLYFFLNGLLWMLFLMNIWWCYFIFVLIHRILTGKSKQVEDVRELHITNEQFESNTKSKSNNVSNGKSLSENIIYKEQKNGVSHGMKDKKSEEDLTQDYIVVNSGKEAEQKDATGMQIVKILVKI